MTQNSKRRLTLDEHFSSLDKLYEIRGFLYDLNLLDMDSEIIIRKSKAMANIDAILHKYGYPAQKIIMKQSGDKDE